MRRRRALPSLKDGQGGSFPGRSWENTERFQNVSPTTSHRPFMLEDGKQSFPKISRNIPVFFRTKKTNCPLSTVFFPDKTSTHWLMCHSQFAFFIIFWILFMSWNTSIFNVSLFLLCLVNLHEIQAHQRPASRHTTSQGASPRSQAQPRFRQVLYPCRIQWQTQSVSLWIYGDLMSI